MTKLGACVLLVACAGTRHLDPPPPPPAAMPGVTMPATAPAPNTARVVVDVTDGPAELQLKTSQPGGAQWQPMCTTPCVVDVQPGRIEASFKLGTRGDYTTIDVGPGLSVYRRSLGDHSDSPALLAGGYTVSYLGITTLLVGLMLRAIASDPQSMISVGAANATLLVGGGMTIAGGIMFYYGWPTEQPGSATQFAPR